MLRWPAGFAVLMFVLTAAGSVPAQAGRGDDDEALYAQCRKAGQELADEYRQVENASFMLICQRPDGTIVDPKLLWPAPPTRPAPTRPITAGQAGCVAGPGRPMVDTTLTSVSATAGPGEAITYQYQQLHGGEPINASGMEVLEFDPGELAPGESYRWRARADDRQEQARNPISFNAPDDEQGWSPWCEFTVSPDAIDYRGLGDVSLEALNELGLRPDRAYTIRLTGRQQRLLRAGTNVGRTHARMTLTGPRWTDLLLQLTESAFIADEVAAEADEDHPAPDGTAYRTLVDAISVKLGGPHHPQLS
ncbi:hypothetical protein BG844_32290 [Couchioplanes caeruleus subsp. caeruleus]|uniref:Fibronectin type-III domain-containing protein n=1 Tax=Couchioplanes caeruleus subsp. caeruleus TaxID=56427 RepID=A0A1K0GHL5_9ACTN|nr:hypothetical protein BG844_32290 [Couchioplanes caeruleus subsp. caeruleus]